MKKLLYGKEKKAANRVLPKSKATIGMLLIAGSLLFTACGRKEQDKNTDAGEVNTPEAVAECVMEDLKLLDLKDFNENTDNYVQTYTNFLGMPTSVEYRVFNELLQPGLKKAKRYERSYKIAERIVENMSWEIKDVREKDAQAEIDMEITNIDMGKVMDKYEIFILEDVLQSEGFGFWQFTKDMADLAQDAEELLNIMDSLGEEDICTMEVTVSTYKEDGSWKLHISDEFINAFMGNINAEEHTEDMEQRIAELEKQYDEKLDEWEEDFTNKVENWVERNF